MSPLFGILPARTVSPQPDLVVKKDFKLEYLLDLVLGICCKEDIMMLGTVSSKVQGFVKKEVR